MSPTLVLNQNAKTKEPASWVPLNNGHPKLQRFYTQSGATYWSVQSLAEARRIPTSKLGLLLHSKRSSTKFTLTTRQFGRLKALFRFKKEILRLPLAYVDNQAKYKKGGITYRVYQDLFDGTIDARRTKTMDSEEPVRAFLVMIKNIFHPKKFEAAKKRNCWRASRSLQRR